MRVGKMESRSANRLAVHPRWWIAQEPNNGGITRE